MLEDAVWRRINQSLQFRTVLLDEGIHFVSFGVVRQAQKSTEEVNTDREVTRL
jgi:hypothetical protein